MSVRHILHVNKRFYPEFSGEAVFMEKLIPVLEIIEHGLSHSVMATETVAASQEYANCHSIRDVIFINRDVEKRRSFYKEFIIYLLRNFRKINAVHFHSHVDRHFIITIMLKVLGKKVFYTATLDDSVEGLLSGYRPTFRPFIRFMIRFWDRFIVISDKLFNESKAYLPIDKLVHIPIGIHMPVQHPQSRQYPPQGRTLTCLFVGGLCRRKDPLFLVEQIGALRAQGFPFQLILVGPELESDYVQQIDDFIAQNNLEDVIIRTGRSDDPALFYAKADIFTFTSHSEGFGTVVIEAMSHGLPVVARRLPGVNEEFVVHNQTGFLFDKEEDFAVHLKQLYTDRQHLKRMGDEGRAFVEARYDMGVIARAYLGAYGVEPSLLKEALEKRWAPSRASIRAKFLSNGARASILDKRVHQPFTGFLDGITDDRPILITSIDTEEEFDWRGRFLPQNTSATNLLEQEAAQNILERYGVVPTYLLTYPVAQNYNMAAQLKQWCEDGLCEIGAHLHPWVTPPFEEDAEGGYAGNIDPRLEFDKLFVLTSLIQDQFKVRPTAFRAGRYGVSRNTADILRTLGYKYDLSVLPNRSYRDDGGVNFWGFKAEAYWTDKQHEVLEAPLSSEVIGKINHLPLFFQEMLFHNQAERLHIPGIMRRLGWGERIRLSPEGHSLEDAQRLLTSSLSMGRRFFSLSYHSSSLLVGATPYVQSNRERSEFLDWLDRFYMYFLNELNGKVVRISDLAT